MKRLLILAILFSILLVPTVSMARTNFFFNIGLGLPLPVVVAPAPVIVALPPVVVAPAPVIVAPPVYVQPGPVFYGPPGWYHGRKRGWYNSRW
jgi:PXPV repeat (3 copies)